MNPDETSPAELAVMLSLLPTTHPLITAALVGIEVGALREGTPLNLDDYVGGRYHRNHELAEHTEVQIRRWPPTGNRELWVRYGPAGPPRADGNSEVANVGDRRSQQVDPELEAAFRAAAERDTLPRSA